MTKQLYRVVKNDSFGLGYYKRDGVWTLDKNLSPSFSKTGAQKVRNMLALTFLGSVISIEEIK